MLLYCHKYPVLLVLFFRGACLRLFAQKHVFQKQLAFSKVFICWSLTTLYIRKTTESNISKSGRRGGKTSGSGNRRQTCIRGCQNNCLSNIQLTMDCITNRNLKYTDQSSVKNQTFFFATKLRICCRHPGVL